MHLNIGYTGFIALRRHNLSVSDTTKVSRCEHNNFKEGVSKWLSEHASTRSWRIWIWLETVWKPEFHNIVKEVRWQLGTMPCYHDPDFQMLPELHFTHSVVDSTSHLVLIRIEVDRIDKVYLSFFPPQSPVSVLQFGAAVSSALGCTDWVGWWIRNLSIQQTSRIKREFTQKWKSFISCSTFYWGREGQL